MKEAVKKFLELMSNQEDGKCLYKFFGGCWELAYPIFKKYAPKELQAYEDRLPEEFTYFNPQVEKILSTGDEKENWTAAVNYYNSRMASYANPQDVDFITDPTTGDDIPYVPNQSIDAKQYFGREE
jgi:hypothetical protein